jgi:hypothetical protein
MCSERQVRDPPAKPKVRDGDLYAHVDSRALARRVEFLKKEQ